MFSVVSQCQMLSSASFLRQVSSGRGLQSPKVELALGLTLGTFLLWVAAPYLQKSAQRGGSQDLTGVLSPLLLAVAVGVELVRELSSASLYCSWNAQTLWIWLLDRSLSGRRSQKNPALHVSLAPPCRAPKQEEITHKNPLCIVSDCRSGTKLPAPTTLLVKMSASPLLSNQAGWVKFPTKHYYIPLLA